VWWGVCSGGRRRGGDLLLGLGLVERVRGEGKGRGKSGGEGEGGEGEVAATPGMVVPTHQRHGTAGTQHCMPAM